MPYIELKIDPVPSAEQAVRLADGVTDAMVELAGKRRELTAESWGYAGMTQTARTGGDL